MPFNPATEDPIVPESVGQPGNLLILQRLALAVKELRAAGLLVGGDVGTGGGNGNGNGGTVVTESPLLSYTDTLDVPNITKRTDLIIGTKAQIGLGSIYVSWMIRVPDEVVAAFPQYGRWRVYTSTDHDSGRGGIAIGVSSLPDPLDMSGWSWLRNAGSPIMFSEGSSSQVETPCVVWNKSTKLFHLYYQTQTGSGSTLLQMTRVATSADGVTGWTVVGDAIPNPSNAIAGFNHRGYARVYNIDGLWCAWHLQGNGTAVSAYGWSFSNDGLTFVADRRRVGAALHMGDGVLRTGLSTLLHWRGQVWAIGTLTEYVSGATASSSVRVWTAPINLEDDLRSLRGRPTYMDWPMISPETTLAGPPPNFVAMDDGRHVGALRINGENGALALAVLA